MGHSQKLSDKVYYIQNHIKEKGVDNVYFEPPQNIKMFYPCVVFKRGVMSSRHAGNKTYKIDDAWDLTYIRFDPDDEIPHQMLEWFQMIRHTRTFVADGLHHDQFKLYY